MVTSSEPSRPVNPAERAPVAGPVLEASELGRTVAAAILRANPGARLRDQGAYLRIESPGNCRVTRAELELALGRSFALPGELEQLMPSFRGQLLVNEDEAQWSLP